MTGPGDELAELLWDHGPALLRRAPPPQHPPPLLFQPFTCSAAGSSRSHELKQRHAAAADATTTRSSAFVTPVPVPVPLGMHMHGLGGHDAAADDDDAVPWLHCPVVVDDDADTAPLPPEYCAGLLLPEYSGSASAAPPHAVAVPAAPPPETAAANKLDPPGAAAAAGREGVVNFTFFSRPLQRAQQPAATATASHGVESTVIQAATITNRLRSTPLFSEHRMAWLQPPKPPAAAAAAAPPPAAAQPPLQAPPLLSSDNNRHGETVAVAAQQPRSSQSKPEATRAADAAAAAVTTSSVCSGNGDRGQLKRSSCHFAAADCSVSPDEDQDVDDEPGATRRSAARSSKRSRTAEVHNMSERRRRDRINEKMRALQELIPNCNKVDKASMLEEAIEYLKTLQLQVQMMSMGTGLCMPPAPAMLLPAAAMRHHLQALHHHHSMAHAHFQHHLGMGLFGAHFPMAMPPPPPGAAAAMFGVPPPPPPGAHQGMPAAFAHMAGFGIGGATAAPAAAPARPGEAEHPPVPGTGGVAQGDQEAPQHPKQK